MNTGTPRRKSRGRETRNENREKENRENKNREEERMEEFNNTHPPLGFNIVELTQIAATVERVLAQSQENNPLSPPFPNQDAQILEMRRPREDME